MFFGKSLLTNYGFLFRKPPINVNTCLTLDSAESTGDKLLSISGPEPATITDTGNANGGPASVPSVTMTDLNVQTVTLGT